MVNFSKPNGKICHHAEIYYSFADIYFVNLMIISTFASDKENNNIKKNNTTMANKYSGTQTEKNLRAAFAGESQQLSLVNHRLATNILTSLHAPRRTASSR